MVPLELVGRFGDEAERALKFMGAFSVAQTSIDDMVGLYLRRKMTHLGPALEKIFIARMRDDQRIPLAKAFLDEAGYQGDASNLPVVYERARQTRNLLAHSQGVSGPFPGMTVEDMKRQAVDGRVAIPLGLQPQVWVSHREFHTEKFRKVPRPLMPETFDRLMADCQWISDVMLRGAYDAGIPFISAVQGVSAKAPAVPPALPVGGEPLP